MRRKPQLTLAFLAFAAIVAPRAAFAHPGHAFGAGFGLVHYLIDPSHGGMLPVAVVLGAGVLAWLLGNRRPQLRPARTTKPKGNDRDRKEDRR